MPVYHYQCDNKECDLAGVVLEKVAKMSAVDDVIPCPNCAQGLEREITAANVCWARPLSFYSDKRLEGASSDTHIAHKKTDKGLVPVRLDSIQSIRRFCKEENLTDPTDLNPNAQVSSDGRKLQTAGVSGQWI